MKNQYVSDNQVVFSLQGIRAVSKEDYVFQGATPKYKLTVEYKGLTKTITYTNDKDRDKLFWQLTNELNPE